jgi:iron complex transport system substrate-binding protein
MKELSRWPVQAAIVRAVIVRTAIVVLLALAALYPQTLLAFDAATPSHEIVDSAGRKVVIPNRIERVVAAGPPASTLLTILAPDKLVGWNRAPAPAELAFMPAAVQKLPVVGRLTGRGNTANLETLLGAKPDLIIDFGTISDTYVSLADRTQEQTGIPYVLIDGSFKNTLQALALLGPMLGVTDRAHMLSARIQAVFDRIDAVLPTVPDNQRPRVYLARRDTGLETSYRGSLNTEIIERAGGINVVDTGQVQGGLVNVSLEQILAWNPDTVITTSKDFAAHAAAAPGWKDVAAVQKNRVYLSPSLPYGWIDDPPSLNRTLGLVWLTRLFFPDRFPGDIRADTREFYKLFYQVDVSDAQLDQLLPGKAP